MPTTTPAIEDYLKTIYAHTEWQSEPLTPSVLAGKLGIAPSSVTEMVKKIAALGLVTHVPYGAVRLNEQGTARALSVVRRHRLIETWLVNEMGYTWDAVHDEAEVLEHAMSDRLLAAIDERLGHPTRDPHGDPIPASDGTIVRPDAVLLSVATAGHCGAVVRISDRDPAVLRLLTEHGIELDTPLTLDDQAEAPDAAVLLPSGARLTLSPEALASIWVTA